MKYFSFIIAFCAVFTTTRVNANYWNPVVSGTNKKLLCVSFGSSMVGYIGGADSLLLKTTDGGQTWAPMVYTGLIPASANEDIIDLDFVSEMIGYAVVSDADFPLFQGVMYKTSDGGSSWTQITSGNIALARGYFFDENNGYQIGSAFFSGHTLIKLDNGIWGTEKYFSNDPAAFLYGIDFRNNSTGLVSGTGGYIYRTFDAGTTWDTVKTLIDSTINAVVFLNDSTILGAADNPGGGAIISHDTGRTWQIEMNTLTFAYPKLKSVIQSSKDSFIAVGITSFGPTGIILWHDGGTVNNWMTTQPLYDAEMRDDSVAFAVGDSGLIMTNMPAAVMSVKNTNHPDDAMQVYPNPSDGQFYTTASYRHSITIYDMQGRKVYEDAASLLRHSVDLRNHSSGIYMIEATGSGGQRTMQRVVL